MNGPARGFTLFEVGVTLLIIVFLVFAGSIATSTVATNKRFQAQQDADTLYNAEFGSRDTNGFVGDIGRFTDPALAGQPNQSETLLFKPNALANQQQLRGVTVGWRGPYVGYGPVGLGVDPWGFPWVVETTPQATGRIKSRGPDGILGTSDDITSPPIGTPTLQTAMNQGELDVIVVAPDTLAVLNGNDVTVSVSNPNGTGQVAWPVVTAPNGSDIRFRVQGLATGRHVVRVAGVAAGNYAAAAGYAVGWVAGSVQTCITVRVHY